MDVNKQLGRLTSHYLKGVFIALSQKPFFIIITTLPDWSYRVNYISTPSMVYFLLTLRFVHSIITFKEEVNF